MVGNEEFFKKFRALIILFLLSTPWRKKKTKKAFQSYAVSRTSEAKCTLQIYTAGIWDAGKNCTQDKYLVYAVQWKIVDGIVNHSISGMQLIHCIKLI